MNLSQRQTFQALQCAGQRDCWLHLLKVSALYFRPCGSSAYARSGREICAEGSACCREGFKDPGGLATASRRFLFTFKGEEYIWQSEKESCHVLALRGANDTLTVQRSISLQLWHAAAILLFWDIVDGWSCRPCCLPAEHRRFSGDNLSCIHAASKNEVAYYTNSSILKRKEDGKLRVAEEVSAVSPGGGAAM